MAYDPFGEFEEEDDGPRTDVPEVHAEQTSIPEPMYQPGDLGPCYWCSEPAIHGRIDIGLPKRPGQPKPLVQVCDFHYRHTIAPALARVRAEKEAKLLARRRGARGLD